jgi:hypothetical protein
MIPVDISNWMLQNDFTNNTYHLRKKNDVLRIESGPNQKNTAQQQFQSGVVRHVDKVFYVAIIRQDWLMAYQYADTLENTLPIFTARD